jgi:transposase
MAKSGNQWRMLPKEYPKWELVYYYFRKWTAVGLMEEIHESLRNCCRKQAGRNESPGMGLMGFILAIVIHSVNIQDRVGVRLVLKKLRHKFLLMKKILADGGYSGTLVKWTLSVCGWTLEVVSKVVGISTFSIIPKRWVVDRTFGWVNFNRRLAKDYEKLTETCETMIIIAFTCLMINNNIF